MMRFVKHFLESDGVAIYPIISLLLFFLVFIIMLVIVMKIPKNKIKEDSNLPLEEGNENINNYE